MTALFNRDNRIWTVLAIFFLPSCILTGCAGSGKSTTDSGVGLGKLASQTSQSGSKDVIVAQKVGKGVPFVIGNSFDERRAMELFKDSPDKAYATHNQVYPLGGTKWRITSLKPEGRMAAYKNVTMEFRTNGRVITTGDRIDGKIIEDDECYRVIGDTLAVSRGGYIANFIFQMQSKKLTAQTSGVQATLECVP